jgi:hypothetical protein
MELRKIFKGSKKAQLMTVVMLVIFVLMLSELFVFALLNVSSSTVSQALAVSSASNNYANILRLSANGFASASLSKAIAVLAAYESTPSIRKVNFITNSSLYLTYLMVNGTLPNDTSGYPQKAMGNLTFSAYNAFIANTVSFASQNVIANESRPKIFQTDPYHIRVAYSERVSINASGNNYVYNIPVNASLSLNNTPDLFYAQQGVVRNVRFANMSNITSVIGGAYATSANTAAYDYGTVYTVKVAGQGSATCPIPGPSWLASSPLASTLIIATYSAANLGSCINSFGGLITYVAPSTPPMVPYLVYPSSTNLLAYLTNGTNVLLYGPGLDTLNIESLRSAVMNNYYFASPFASSYLEMAHANLGRQSPNGIFTFTNYNRQAANLPGATGEKISLNSPPARLEPLLALSVSAWVYSRIANGASSTNAIVSTGAGGGVGNYCGYTLGYIPSGYVFQVCNNNIPSSSTAMPIIGTDSWHLLTGVYNASNRVVSLYEDGNLIGSALGPTSITYASPPSIAIGEQPGNGWPFNGVIANVQIYNKSLSARQVQKIYSEGISGLPVSNNGLVGWWPLNGDANDYSGYGLDGSAVGTNFIVPPNYTRDSIFSAPIPSPTSPLPGILCNNNAQCTDNTKPQLFLGYVPLETQGNIPQVAAFNSINAYSASPNIKTSGNIALVSNSFTLTGWFNSRVQCSSYVSGDDNEVLLSQNAQGGFVNPWIELYCAHSGGNIKQWQFALTNSAGASYSVVGNALPLNSWNFAAITYASSTGAMSLYLNGTLQAPSTSASGSIGAMAPLYIGSGESLFPGNIANVQYYNSSVSSNQISQLYQEGIEGLPIQANIIGWWPLDGDARDYAGSNNGIATNVIYPYLSGNYNAPGLSTISVAANEWQALGLANT